MKSIVKPQFMEYARYYEQYLDVVPAELKVLKALKEQAKNLVSLYKAQSEEQLRFAYAEGKWNMKDILMHLIDVERVFVYRAMRFARKDKSPLPFFDENDFAKNAQANNIPLPRLLKEYQSVRAATLAFFNNLQAKQLKETGIAGQASMSVRACVWIIYAHELHHLNIINERYLNRGSNNFSNFSTS
jgi:uncharacterized damage-inducible protein DinB